MITKEQLDKVLEDASEVIWNKHPQKDKIKPISIDDWNSYVDYVYDHIENYQNIEDQYISR